jgi:beta-xylosidase
MKELILIFLSAILLLATPAIAQNKAQNPIIWADVPDMSIVRVGDTYYMASTTMHMSPGLPIMKSKDLVNWEIGKLCLPNPGRQCKYAAR